MLPVILTEKPEYEKAEILSRISFFCSLLQLLMNVLNMYLHAPSNTVWRTSMGVDLKNLSFAC